MKLLRLLSILLLTCNFAIAQISQQTIVDEITANLPTNNRNEISAELLRNTLNQMTSAIFQNQGLSGFTITGTPTIGQAIIATSSSTASWQNIGGLVTSVSNNDGSLIINPNTGNIIGSLNTNHLNIWTQIQNFNAGATSLTRTIGDSTTNIATTAFVLNQTGGAAISGTPLIGSVPLATSLSTAVWGPPPGGLSILSFPGASGDGVTDNAAAFAAALAQISSTTGTGLIYFPPGTFKTSTAYKVPSGIAIKGAGPDQTFLVGDGTCNPDPCNTTLIVYGALTGVPDPTSTTYAINGASQGTTTIVTTTPSDAGNFIAGDFIMISGSLHGTSFWYPDWSTKVVSVNSGTGVITLTEPLPLSGTSATKQSTITITIAAPGVVTWNVHGLTAGTGVVFTNSGGALPTGYTAGVTYYVAQDANLTTNTFDVSDTVAHALAGTNQITTSGSQSGTQTAALGVLTLVQKIVTLPQNVQVSDLAIEGTVNGAVQVAVAWNVAFDNVRIIPSTQVGTLIPGLSIVGARNVSVSRSTVEGGGYIECLGCFDVAITNNILHGFIALDGGTQNAVVSGNNLNDPNLHGTTQPCISVFSMSQYDRIIGNNCTNVRASTFGLDVTNNNGEGNLVIIGNTFSGVNTSSDTCMTLANTTNDIIVGNNCSQFNTGIGAATNSTGHLVAANQMTNVPLQYSLDATSSFQFPITPFFRSTRNNVGATVDVSPGFVVVTNSSPQSITAFSGPNLGQIVTVQFGDSNSSLIASGNLSLLQNTSFLNIPQGTAMQFQQQTSGAWLELSRTQVNIAAIVDVRARTVNGLLTAAGGLSVTGAISGTGITGLFASPPAIGGTAPAAGAFTTLAANYFRSTGTPPTGNTGSCSTGVTVAGGATAGTWTSTAVCALAGTIILTAMPTQTNGYVCSMTDRTTSGVVIEETATSATSATFTVRSLPTGTVATVANDILQYSCIGY